MSGVAFNSSDFIVNNSFKWDTFPLERKHTSILIIHDNEELVSKLVNNLLLLFPKNLLISEKINKRFNYPDDFIVCELNTHNVNNLNKTTIFLDLDNEKNNNDDYDRQLNVSKLLNSKQFHILSLCNVKNVKSSYYEDFDYLFFINQKYSNFYLGTRFFKQINGENKDSFLVIDTNLEHNTVSFYKYSME